MINEAVCLIATEHPEAALRIAGLMGGFDKTLRLAGHGNPTSRYYRDLAVEMASNVPWLARSGLLLPGIVISPDSATPPCPASGHFPVARAVSLCTARGG